MRDRKMHWRMVRGIVAAMAGRRSNPERSAPISRDCFVASLLAMTEYISDSGSSGAAPVGTG